MQGEPDLVVGTPSVDYNTPDTGESFALSATVSNDGDGDAPATTLRYYRSDGCDDYNLRHVGGYG